MNMDDPRKRHEPPYKSILGQFLKPSEVAARWRMSERTLQRKVKQKLVPEPLCIGRLKRFNLAEIVAFERTGGPVNEIG